MATSLRRETAGLVRLAERDLSALWLLVERGEADAREALHDLLPAIILTYGEAGAAMAADWYDDRRERQEVRRRFTASPIPADDRGAAALIGWALTEARDDTTLRTLVAGGMQRRIAAHQRLTVTSSSVADPAAQGWVRVGRGDCDWCAQYLDGVVRTVAYDFDAHDWCKCDAEPVWG